jgi:hypothetical protein
LITLAPAKVKALQLLKASRLEKNKRGNPKLKRKSAIHATGTLLRSNFERKSDPMYRNNESKAINKVEFFDVKRAEARINKSSECDSD